MNWWVKCISAVIAKTASRNVAFKARKLSDSIMDSQDSFIMRELEDAEVYFGDDFEEIVADAGNNADLYAANQGSTELINEARTRRRLRYVSRVKKLFTSNRLVLTKGKWLFLIIYYQLCILLSY